MKVELVRPVDPAQVLAMLAPGSHLEARVCRVQVHAFPCWGFAAPGGQLLAAGGLVPRPAEAGERLVEAWFACWPQASRAMLGILRLSHLTLRRHCEDAPATVQAFIREGWRPGRRIAAALGFGFDRVEGDPHLGRVERWTARF